MSLYLAIAASILVTLFLCASLAENHKSNRGTLKQHQALMFGGKP